MTITISTSISSIADTSANPLDPAKAAPTKNGAHGAAGHGINIPIPGFAGLLIAALGGNGTDAPNGQGQQSGAGTAPTLHL